MQYDTSKTEHSQPQPNNKPRLVEVKLDGVPRELLADVYQIPQLKSLLGMPSDYELELVTGGKFHPLADSDSYKVHGHEEFISHVRCGGSS